MTIGKTIGFTRRTFVGKVMSLLFNRLVIAFLPKSKHLLILKEKKIKVFFFFSNLSRWVNFDAIYKMDIYLCGRIKFTGRNQEFSFNHVKYDMPIRPPRKNYAGTMSLNSGGAFEQKI